jgi:glycosyltransferase involved in cell wall biosynthesis
MTPIRRMYVVCHNFYDATGSRLAIGGVETYVASLHCLAASAGLETTILQYASREFSRRFDTTTQVITWRSHRELLSRLDALHKDAPGLTIYSDHFCVPPRLHRPALMLQHGVGWDYTATRLTSGPLIRLNHLRKLWRRRRLFARLRWACGEMDAVVAVDTNFRNWLTATFPDLDSSRVRYIPNFADIQPADAISRRWERSGLRILFPRRFAIIRGALLMAHVARSILSRESGVSFAFVGNGECLPAMRVILAGVGNVEFTERPHAEMASEYLASHVAVIPTLAAEGTSLSCIEAMAAGCAVVVTTVGGLGNLVLPDFNGVVCEPSVASVEEGISRLVRDRNELRRLGAASYEVARRAFSREQWERRMSRVLSELSGQ